MKVNALGIFLVLFAFSCNDKPLKEKHTLKLFTLKNNEETGIVFSNNLKDTPEFNVYKYRNYYNGGGVAAGDVNNDGLIDVYMVSNQQKNKLFLNKGNWKFEDVTEIAGVGGSRSWSTGVTMADINSDGFLDIYVCNSGDIKGDNKENELFINNGDGTFDEKAAEYGLNDEGFSTHASFFDYDKDGDLDVYILNNSFRAIGSFDLKADLRNQRNALGGDKLMENRNGKFVDVSLKAGIYGSEIGFGLGITVGDVNNDGWEDIFISNDFFERDYLYINQKNGTFKEVGTERMQAFSAASMGADIADINNDGWNDIFVTDMLPSDYSRLKTVTTFEDWNRNMAGLKNSFHYQYTRNCLHLNRGDGYFSEMSRLAGVEASDWSWGALFFDMDNDGHKDLFIANGIYKDLTNQDYLQYIANENVMKSIISGEGVDYSKLIDIIPSQKVPNHAFKNSGNLYFEKYTSSGLWTESFSNGSTYADLDNDGDLDLVVNNVNMPCFVYENNASQQTGNKYLKIKLTAEGGNLNAVGARVTATAREGVYTYENQPARGFQSSVDPRINIGVGNAEEVDLKIFWPDGKISELNNIKTNQFITIKQSESTFSTDTTESKVKLFQNPLNLFGDFKHVESEFNEFNREGLIYHMLSTQGPCTCQGDIDGDGIDDIVIPGAKGMMTAFFKGTDGDTFSKMQLKIEESNQAEYIKCILFDVNNDGLKDLYLASGSTEDSEYSEYLKDVLYINNGKGGMTKSSQALPDETRGVSTGAVAAGDINGDGFDDLVVGERVNLGSYGGDTRNYILINDQKGGFTDQTEIYSGVFAGLGMVTDIKITDVNNDKKNDVIVVGDFLAPHIFISKNQKLELIPVQQELSGWWNKIEIADINGDGDIDFVLGNHGQNSRFRTENGKSIRLYVNDFDGNGFPEGIITGMLREDQKYYPFDLRHNLLKRLPYLTKKYPDFTSFKEAAIDDIFDKNLLQNTKILEAFEMRSGVMLNSGNLRFSFVPFPSLAQLSPVYAIKTIDLNKDGKTDIVIGGNLFEVKPEFGKYDASIGNILLNQGGGKFADATFEYGLRVSGQVRSINLTGNTLHFFRNNDSVISYKIQK
jgi:hypothetical protein